MAAPSDSTKLLRIVTLLIDQVSLIKDFQRVFETDAVFPLDVCILRSLEVEARI